MIDDVAAIELDGPRWICKIDHASPENTFVFEASHHMGGPWFPINGQRLAGPGPKVGSIITNAVQGGPAQFNGPSDYFNYFRVRRTRSDDQKVSVYLSSLNSYWGGFIGEQDAFNYIIYEEMSIEDALNSS